MRSLSTDWQNAIVRAADYAAPLHIESAAAWSGRFRLISKGSERPVSPHFERIIGRSTIEEAQFHAISGLMA
jgi:hypothetical protein